MSRGIDYKPTAEELSTISLYGRAMAYFLQEGGMESVFMVFIRMNRLQKINYCYHIEKLAYDDVPWAKKVLAKATLLRLQS